MKTYLLNGETNSVLKRVATSTFGSPLGQFSNEDSQQEYDDEDN